MTDIEFLNQVIEKIEVNPEQHYQAYWAVKVVDGYAEDSGQRYTDIPYCGTAKCLAGWAAEMAGWTPVFDDNWPSLSRTAQNEQGEVKEIRDIAREALGLTNFQANELFSASNTLDDIKSIRDKIHIQIIRMV